ncbi:hypothetical protein [Cerasicoccus frondis]|uniref:hypothetical protein n=1 Tax=Cerasicoccus frondis TaxID=490090 RepID=UPI002852888D|nr:hypothetical protein [Cerasicoccus frondis]
MEEAKAKLVAYYQREIEGWDLIAWIAQTSPGLFEDRAAVDELLNLDEALADGYRKEVQDLLFKLIPDFDNEKLGMLLFLDCLDKLRTEKISPVEFVSFVCDVEHSKIHNEDAPYCDCIRRIYSEYCGYGFADLQEMKNHELVEIVEEYLSEENT